VHPYRRWRSGSTCIPAKKKLVERDTLAHVVEASDA